MQRSEAIVRKIDELRPRFVAMLSERLDRFEEIRDAMAATGANSALLAELRFGAHRIVGLAATLGFDDLGTLAKNVEFQLLAALEGSAPPSSARSFLEPIDQFLGEMALIVHGMPSDIPAS